MMRNAGDVFTVKVLARMGGRVLALRENYSWVDALACLNVIGDGDDVICSIIDQRNDMVVVKANPPGLIFDENHNRGKSAKID